MTVYDRIDRILKEKNLSRRKLARLAGIPETTLASAFSRKPEHFPNKYLISIAAALEVDPGELAAGWPGLKIIDRNNSVAPEQEKVIPSVKLSELNLSSVENDQSFIRMAIAYSRLNEEAQEMAAGIVESIAQNPLCQKAENR